MATTKRATAAKKATVAKKAPIVKRKPVLKKTVYHSQIQRDYVAQGKNQDDLLRAFVTTSLGLDKNQKVKPKRHTILSGPPGIGKTYTTMSAIHSHKVNFIQFGAGTTQSAMVIKLGYWVKNLKPDEELVVLLDDADDVVLSNYADANRFKDAMAKPSLNPHFRYDVNLTGTRAAYLKAGKTELVETIDHFSVLGEVGMNIPTNQVRFILLCNLDLESPKLFKGKLKGQVEAIVDRVKYKRLNFSWEVSWGWLAHILDTTQPFEDEGVLLNAEQKYELSNWMWNNWTRVRNTSYRTIEEMAGYMINYPDSYGDHWTGLLKSNGVK